MAEQRDALTELVKSQVGPGQRYSTRAFAGIAVDPVSGWGPGKSLVAKIIAGQGYDITPRLVSAIAIGLGLDREIVAAAAHFQLIGYRDAELREGAPAQLLLHLAKSEDDVPLGRAVAERWEEERRHP